MSELRAQTIALYDNQAAGLSEKYGSMPSRVSDIELMLELAGNPEHARVLEIGCAAGRDAAEIVKRVDWYLGIDTSAGFVEMARQHVPDGTFEVADAADFKYPNDLDAVFAAASLIHLNKDELKNLYKKLSVALRAGGVIYQSLKYSPEYRSEVFADEFGPRQYYFYNLGLVKELASPAYEVAHTRQETREGLNHTSWIEIALRRL
jgi:SAM-dependent methyltransferase